MKACLLAASVVLCGVGAARAECPERDLRGIIQWDAGGSTDMAMRAVAPHAEALPGRKMVMSDRIGGVGAIAAFHPEFERFSPWGPVFGISVHKNTPEEAVGKLRAAYAGAADQG